MPLDRGLIDQQLQALGESPRWWEERELRDLPAVLQADERILAIARGKLARLRWLRRSWLLVVSDRRLLCLRAGRRATWSQLEVGRNLIARVTLRIGPFSGCVIVVAGGHTYRIRAPRPDAYKLFNALSTFVPPTRDDLPGFRPTLMMRRVIDHVLALPAAALQPGEHRRVRPPAEGSAMEHVQSLEEQLIELRKQVDFLEQLLHQQHENRPQPQTVGPD